MFTTIRSIASKFIFGLGLLTLGFLLLVGCSILVPSPPGGLPSVINITVDAQSLPVTKTLVWSASTNADSYLVYQDTAQIGTPTALSQAFTITTLGAHTMGVAAKNIWGLSSTTPLTINVNLPSAPGGLGVQ